MKEYKKVNEKVYSAEDNFVKKADQFFIAVAVNSRGEEGVIAEIDLSRFPIVEKPLMGATISDKEAIMSAAEKASKEGDIKVRVLRYTVREVIAEFVPKNLN